MLMDRNRVFQYCVVNALTQKTAEASLQRQKLHNGNSELNSTRYNLFAARCFSIADDMISLSFQPSYSENLTLSNVY